MSGEMASVLGGYSPESDRLARLESELSTVQRAVRVQREYTHAIHRLMGASDGSPTGAAMSALLDDALLSTMRIIEAKDSALLVRDEANDDLVFVACHGDVRRERLIWRRLPRKLGLANWVLKHRQPVIANNARADERFHPGVDEELMFSTKSLLAAPLIHGGQTVGVVEVLNKQESGCSAGQTRSTWN